MILLIIVFLVGAFGFVIFFGAPYLPVLRKQSDIALDLLDLKKGEVLLELGSGDGRILRLAAQRGLTAVGYELNPILVVVSIVVTWKYRKNVRIIWGNFWNKPWPPAQGIYVFLIDKYMDKLNTRIEQYPDRPIKLVSFAFQIPGKKPAKTKSGLYLYNF